MQYVTVLVYFALIGFELFTDIFKQELYMYSYTYTL